MKKITIFTPTFNRAYLLPQLYQSLISQSNQNFIWLIIDDGSFDDTQELIDSWKAEDKIEIQYFFQSNQGMHGAHNTAYQKCTTELNICIDSDDFLPNDAVDIIIQSCNNLPDNCAGIVGLDADKNGILIGTAIPTTLKEVKLNELYSKHRVLGDKKVVDRKSVV